LDESSAFTLPNPHNTQQFQPLDVFAHKREEVNILSVQKERTRRGKKSIYSPSSHKKCNSAKHSNSNLKPQNTLEKEKSQISCLYHKNTQNPKTKKKTNDLPRDLRGKITKKRGTPTSCVIPNTNPTKNRLQNLPAKIHQKDSANHRKGNREIQDPQANQKGTKECTPNLRYREDSLNKG
jgi:hypothetical protein